LPERVSAIQSLGEHTSAPSFLLSARHLRQLALVATEPSIFVVRLPSSQPQNFTGLLLVAHPSMLDPNFRRSVLFISSHDTAQGALGLIVNRPLDKHVSDLVTEPPPAALADVPVFLGGPVGTNQLMFASFDWNGTDSLRLTSNVALEDADKMAEKDHSAIRAFVGYAGWNAGQLENELSQNAWVLQKPTREALRPERLPRLWFEIMRGLGPWFKMLSAAPDDPSLN
jgi:putative transcriptional regulator